MPYCSTCGQEVSLRAKFCSNCGSPLDVKGPSPATVADMGLLGSFGRALWVSDMALGLVFQFLGLLTLFAPQFSTSTVGFGALFFSVGTLALLSGFGGMKRRRWVRTSRILAGIGLLATGLLIFRANAAFTALGVFAIVLGIATLAYPRLTPR